MVLLVDLDSVLPRFEERVVGEVASLTFRTRLRGLVDGAFAWAARLQCRP